MKKNKNGLFALAFFILLLSCKEKENLKDGLVGYWSFDNCTARDNSLNGYNGVITGEIDCVFGTKKKAFRFKGEDGEGITIKNLPLMKNFTINFCFKINSLPNEFNNIIAFEPPNDELNIFFLKDNYKLKLEKKNSSQITITTHDLDQDKFYCFSMVNDFDNHKQKFYLNGLLIKQLNSSEEFKFTNLKIGYENDFNFVFNGIIDEVSLYNRALNNKEVKILHNRLLNGKNIY
jgi:hypothetical protein